MEQRDSNQSCLWHQGARIPWLVKDGKPATTRPSAEAGPAHSHAPARSQHFHSKQAVIVKDLSSLVPTQKERLSLEGMG